MCPTATRKDQRGKPGGFIGDPDVMDTWATSSSHPRSPGRWEEDPEFFAQGLPDGPAPPSARDHPDMAVLDRRALRAGALLLPWHHAAISGWILDPDRKKIGKSLGNAITPLEYLEKYGTDAVRYWAGSPAWAPTRSSAKSR